LECTYVQHVVGTIQMHSVMMMMMVFFSGSSFVLESVLLFFAHCFEKELAFSAHKYAV